jgi:Uma2 family endonuclease
MTVPARKRTDALLTAEDLYELPDRGCRYELVAGELRSSEPAGFQHSEIAFYIGYRLAAHVYAHGLGAVTGADGGFVLARKPDTVRGPDVAFVAADRLPRDEVAHRFFEGAPDLAVEVVSPNDRATEIEEKAVGYLRTGVRLVWVVYPPTRRVVVHSPGRTTRTLEGSDALDGGDVVPGFTCPVADPFPARPSVH